MAQQCPLSGVPLFYEIQHLISRTVKACQCPTSGDHHFYPSETNTVDPYQDCVAMPSIGRTSFPQTLRKETSWYCMQQCPLSGVPHFYLKRRKRLKASLHLCQFHSSVLHHFYLQFKTHYSAQSKHRVNALFSSTLHFYKESENIPKEITLQQYPTSGLHYFHICVFLLLVSKTISRVNALSIRGTTISTIPIKTYNKTQVFPLFYI